jgi:phosphoglycerate dehydrogenase-like enzyme
MSVSVALYDKTLDRIKPQVDALGLDITLRPYTADCVFVPDGAGAPPVEPSQMDIDYLWLSPDHSADGTLAAAFTLAKNLRSLKVLQTFNAGLDHPGYRPIADRGVRICNSSAQAIAISEYVMAHVLDVFQPLRQRHQLQAERTWQRTPFREIARTNWLIFGYGPIGRSVAKRAKAFDARTTVIRRTPATSDFVDRSGTLADTQSFLREADVIVLACPLNAETRGLAGADFFAALKPDTVLVNIARGALIDDAAMMAALDAGQFQTAVLDVFHTEPLPADDPLWTHPKIRMTAHTSFNGSGVRQRWLELFLDNLPRYVRGEDLINEVAPDDIP